MKSEVILTSLAYFKGQLWFRVKIRFRIRLRIGLRMRLRWLGLEDGEMTCLSESSQIHKYVWVWVQST